MHLLHVKSSTTCHINISVFMDAAAWMKVVKSCQLWRRGQGEAVCVCLLGGNVSHNTFSVTAYVSIASTFLSMNMFQKC